MKLSSLLRMPRSLGAPLYLLALFCVLALPAWGQTPLLAFESPSPPEPGEFSAFGDAVASVPDVDGDGAEDLVVGAPSEAVGDPIQSRGRAYVFSGLSGALIHTFTTPNPGGVDFGASVAGVSDLDGDGRGEVLVGQPTIGAAYVFSGATGTLLHTLVPSVAGRFGSSVAGVPDTDGDGVADLLVGARSESVGSTARAGAAYLYSGATGALLHRLPSPDPRVGGDFGKSVSGVPDADGDGAGDLLIGAPGSGGQAFVFSGATGAFLFELLPTSGFGRTFGTSVAGSEDIDGDGRGDLLVGAWQASLAARGRAYAYSGATGDMLYPLTSPSPELGGHFGASVASVPDVNGDGHDDILTSAFGERIPGGAFGRAYVFSGATGTLVQTIFASDLPFGFGGSPNIERVAGVSDTDGDGRGELFIGVSVVPAGRAYLFSGAAVDLRATATSPVVLEPGDTFAFDYAITSKTAVPLTGAIRTEVRTASGTVVADFGPVVGGTLQAGATFSSDAEQQIPLGAAPGQYRYALVAETTEGTLHDVETLEITVAGSARVAASNVTWPAPAFHGRFADAVVDALSLERVESAAGTGASSATPEAFALSAAYPNPFRRSTTLAFALPEAGRVMLAVYDVLGRRVATLVDGEVEAGQHEALLDGADLPSGTYLVRLTTARGEVAVQRVTLVR